MPSFTPYSNIYQQTRSDQHTNISKQSIKTYSTAKENYEALSGSLRVHIGKDDTINSPKSPE